MNYDTFLRHPSAPVRKSVTDNEIRDAWSAAHTAGLQSVAPSYGGSYVQSVLVDERALIVNEGGRMYKVAYAISPGGQLIFDEASRVEVRQSWTPVVKCGGPAVSLEKCGRCPHATEGERVAAAKGEFTDCMTRIVPKANPDDPEAFCAWYEHEQTGQWPGEKSKEKSAGPRVAEDGE